MSHVQLKGREINDMGLCPTYEIDLQPKVYSFACSKLYESHRSTQSMLQDI